MLQWLRRKLSPWSPEHQRSVAKFPGQAELDPPSPADLAAMGMTVAFFTRDSIYETEKNRLVRSAERLQLPVDAQAIDTTGSWRNAAMKPGVLVGMRRKHRGPMLYVDVDAVFHRNPWPSLAALDCDIAAYHEPDGHLLSGTLYINDTPAAATLLDEWAAACGANPDEWDQLVLERILAEDAARAEPRYRQARLPVAYCWIFDKIDNAASAQVYIEHLQASRENKPLRGCSASPAATYGGAATGSGR